MENEREERGERRRGKREGRVGEERKRGEKERGESRRGKRKEREGLEIVSRRRQRRVRKYVESSCRKGEGDPLSILGVT